MNRSVVFVSIVLLAGASHAGQLDFSETPVSITHGFMADGVQFTWSNPASASQFQYGATLDTTAFQVTLLSDPVLQGPGDGNLAIGFPSPVNALSFALAVCCGPMSGGIGATVSIGALNQPVEVLLTASELVSEGLFSYAGPPITGVTLAFPEASMFAVDNLAFSAESIGAPEPDTAILISAGFLLLGLACAGKRRWVGLEKKIVTGDKDQTLFSDRGREA